MPDTEAPLETAEVSSSRTSIIDGNSSGSESNPPSDYEFEVNVSNSLTNSSLTNSISNSVSTSVSASVSSSELDFVTSSNAWMPIPGLENIRIPINFNLKQLLMKVTETNDLESVTNIRLRVMARDFSIQRLPTYLPNLRELDLNGSCLMTLRDLGCGMKSLEVLHVCRTGLNSLDGLFGLSGLVELYAANNNIKDVSPCSALHRIQILDLANNVIKDERTVSFLILCTTLKELILRGNPTESIENYRTTVKEILPDIESLDGINYFEADRPVTRSLNSLKLNEDSPDKIFSRFPSIVPRGMHKENPELKPLKRPNTTGSMDIHRKEKFKMIPIRPATARKATENDFNCIVNGSQLKLENIRQMFIPSKLTSGEPICGNPALGLWQRRKLPAWQEETE